MNITFALAEYDFEAARADCISFRKGDLLTVLKMEPGTSWWTGSGMDGRIGIFPKTYVRLNDVPEALDVALAEYTWETDYPGDIGGFEEGDEIIVIRRINEDWWFGRHVASGREGVFPSIYVKLTGELDYAAAEQEANKWNERIAAARAYHADFARKLEEAERELELERKRLEEANAAAAEARHAAEREAKEARDARREADVDIAKKREIELAKVREEAEKRHADARAKLVSLKIEENSANQIRAAADAELAKRDKARKKKEEDERFADPLAGAALAAPKKGPGSGPAGGAGAEDAKKAGGRFQNLGGGDKCPKCGLTVGHAEKVKGPGDSSYHAKCLVCTQCGKSLLGGNGVESGGKPYCAVCYGRNFGPKGFGFGGSVVAVDNSKPGGPRGKVEIDEVSPLEALKRGAKS